MLVFFIGLMATLVVLDLVVVAKRPGHQVTPGRLRFIVIVELFLAGLIVNKHGEHTIGTVCDLAACALWVQGFFSQRAREARRTLRARHRARRAAATHAE